MYILEGIQLPSKEPWRVRVGLRPKPSKLRFLSLDKFAPNKSILTSDHISKLRDVLVKTVEASWKTLKPIRVIRLVGHTDSTGPGPYNVGLGDKRADAVARELLKIKELSGRVKIVVSPSPGRTEPTADNRTSAGKASNRRVEVFIETDDEASSTTSGKIDLTVHTLPPGSIIQTPPPPPYIQGSVPKLPPGTTLKQWVYKHLGGIPTWLKDKIWEAVLGKNFPLVGTLLDQSGLGATEKQIFLEGVRALSESPSR